MKRFAVAVILFAACASLTTAGGNVSFVFTPTTSITDAASNQAVGSITVNTIRLF